MKNKPKPRDTRDNRDTRPGGKLAPAPETLLKPFSFTGWGYQAPALGTAEARAQLSDQSAAYFEQSAREPKPGAHVDYAAQLTNLAKEQRTLADWWRKLGDFPEADAKPHYEAIEADGKNAIDALLARAEKHEGALLPLASLLHDLLAGMHALTAHGNELAGRMLLNTVGDSVEQFELLATTKPELFRSYARGSVAIPGMISRNAEKQADNQRLLKQLEQGEDCRLATLPTGKRGKKWQFQERANGLAVRLVGHIDFGRTAYDLHALQAHHAGRELPEWLHKAKQLEPLTGKNWKAWAGVAWLVLAEISPGGKPANHPAFYDRETKICNVRQTRKEDDFRKSAKWDSRVVRDCPSIAAEDIREALFGAFETIATGASPRTKRRKKTPAKSKRKSHPGQKAICQVNELITAPAHCAPMPESAHKTNNGGGNARPPATTTTPTNSTGDNNPEFLDAAGIQSRFGIKRSLLYVLLDDGSIRGVSLRRRGQLRGKRLFCVDSVRAFLASQMEGAR